MTLLVNDLCISGTLPSSLVTFLSNRELDSLTLGQGDLGLVTLTDNENVGQSGGKSPVQDILDVDNVESTLVPLPVNNDTTPAHVPSSGNHDDVTDIKLDVVNDLVVNKVELDSVVSLDNWVGVSDSSSVVGDQVRNSLLSELVRLDLQELEGGLLRGDSVDGESSLDIVQETEVLARSLNGDDVHESSRVSLVGPDLSVNLDGPLGQNGGDLTTGQSVLETVSEEDGQRKGLPKLVRTGGRSGSVSSRQLVQHP